MGTTAMEEKTLVDARVMAEAAENVNGSRISSGRMQVCLRLPTAIGGDSRRDGRLTWWRRRRPWHGSHKEGCGMKLRGWDDARRREGGTWPCMASGHDGGRSTTMRELEPERGWAREGEHDRATTWGAGLQQGEKGRRWRCSLVCCWGRKRIKDWVNIRIRIREIWVLISIQDLIRIWFSCYN